jgi:hypothetical protein
MLPSENEMMAYVKEIYDEMEKNYKPKRHTHKIYPKVNLSYLNLE